MGCGKECAAEEEVAPPTAAAAIEAIVAFTQDVVANFVATPRSIEKFLYEAEMRAAERHRWVANMFFGRAVERAVNEMLSKSVFSEYFEYTGNRSGPDFIGWGPLAGARFDITTTAAVANHTSRAYYEAPGVSAAFVTYDRPSSWSL
jgi:hypothetical protein